MDSHSKLREHLRARIEELNEELDEIGAATSEREKLQTQYLDGRKDEAHELLRQLDRWDDE